MMLNQGLKELNKRIILFVIVLMGLLPFTLSFTGKYEMLTIISIALIILISVIVNQSIPKSIYNSVFNGLFLLYFIMYILSFFYGLLLGHTTLNDAFRGLVPFLFLSFYCIVILNTDRKIFLNKIIRVIVYSASIV